MHTLWTLRYYQPWIDTRSRELGLITTTPGQLYLLFFLNNNAAYLIS